MALADLRASARVYAATSATAPNHRRGVPGDDAAQAGFAAILAHREIDPEERSAGAAEPALPPIGTPERARADERHQAELAGLLEGSRKRPPSWRLSWPNKPTPGAKCSCCSGTRFWTQDGGHGWCCAVCHPASGGQAVTEVGNKIPSEKFNFNRKSHNAK